MDAIEITYERIPVTVETYDGHTHPANTYKMRNTTPSWKTDLPEKRYIDIICAGKY